MEKKDEILCLPAGIGLQLRIERATTCESMVLVLYQTGIQFAANKGSIQAHPKVVLHNSVHHFISTSRSHGP